MYLIISLDSINVRSHLSLHSLHNVYCIQAVSHLPVAVAAILAPDIIQAVEKGETVSLSRITLAALNKTLKVLHKVKDVTMSDAENLFTQQQVNLSRYYCTNKTNYILIHSSSLRSMYFLSHIIQKFRQIAILDITEQFIASLLHSGTVQPSLTLLDEFGESLNEYLRENSRDAVCDYLQK